MTFLRVAALNGASIVVRLVGGFVVNKIVAVAIGPAGMALVGQLQNFMSAAGAVAGAGLATGVVRHTAIAADDASRARLWSSAAKVIACTSVLAAMGSVLFAGRLSEAILQTTAFAHLFAVAAVALVLTALGGLLLAVLNGLQRYRRHIAASLLVSLAGFVLMAGLTWRFGLQGALIGVILTPALSFVVGLAAVRGILSPSQFIGRIDWRLARSLAAFSAMAIVSTLVAAGAQLFVRELIGQRFGWEAAGHWQAVQRISDYYLLVVTSSLSLYYLPRLAGLTSPEETRREVLRTVAIVMPFVCLAAAAIYLARSELLVLLFSAAFAGAADLVLYQLLADVLKIGSWLVGYLMWARGMTRLFLGSELAFGATYVAAAWACIEIWGLRGSTMAAFFAYVLYAGFVAVAFKWMLHAPRPVRADR